MRLLALDTTTAVARVALVEDERVLAVYSDHASRSHAEKLPSTLVHVLDGVGLALSDVDAFAVAAGPGSFTGLRIGIATIQGLAFVLRRPVVAVSVLDALGHLGAADEETGSQVAVWMDARRHEVFSALYRVAPAPAFGLDRLTVLEPPAVGGPADAIARWSHDGWRPAVFVGDGAELYRDLIAHAAIKPGASAVALAMAHMAVHRVREGRVAAPADLQPLYVRRPDAEYARERLNAAR
jgi:tRNA threonylcarbamoyladenosine biosynthesis protein TsaB